MILNEFVLVKLVTAILALFGFFVARHIYKEKRADRPLICPIKFDCQTVVHSDYSKFLGVPVEVFGMIYYIFVFSSYLALAFLGAVLPQIYVVFLVLLSVFAFLFSMYLILVQIFILRKFCSWCLVSAFICSLIFLLTIQAYDFVNLFEVFVK
ncbi:MAG: vitamin K epoxide reductase family protein [Candidatus Pacebacteria bacterium]|nr:vitamin K epoxide reductase family protein [Candidatus Paceibacterota bacterium]